jgi:hypothetical protein
MWLVFDSQPANMCPVVDLMASLGGPINSYALDKSPETDYGKTCKGTVGQ